MMTALRSASVAVVLILLGATLVSAQQVETESRVAALVGLARIARDQGRAAEAATRFREANAYGRFRGVSVERVG